MIGRSSNRAHSHKAALPKQQEFTAAGLPTKEVATRLNKSTATVRNQLYEAMRKLDVHTRYELIAILRPAAVPGPVAALEPECLEYAI